jgi:HAD superfamily hydrolase (TIGR01509 family)
VSPALVIFDCDGVLVDSERISHEVLVAMLAEHGVRMGFDEALDRFMGTSMQRCMEIVEQLCGVPAVQFLPAFRARTFAAFEAGLEPVPGILQALQAVQSLRLPCCVASNGPHEKMRLTLRRTGLLARFEHRVFSADDVPRPKPAPDLFLHAAARMNADPAACVVVEDSPTGIAAARAAGMAAWGYAGMTPAARLASAGAHATFVSMQELPARLRAAAEPRAAT